MRILHIIDLLSFGGAQQVVKGIVENYKDKGAIHLYVLRCSDNMTEIKSSNIHIYQSASRFSFYPLIDIKRIIIEEQIDILHCHLFRSQVCGYLLKALCFPNIKLIFHEHGQAFGSDQSNRYVDMAFKLFLHLSRDKVNLYLAVSAAIQKRLVSHFDIDPDQIFILYNYINTDFFNKENIDQRQIQAEKERLNITEDLFIVGFAGRLVYLKGWNTFLKAVELMSAETHIRFLIAGDGEDRGRLLGRIRETGLGERTAYLGFVKNMPLFYSILDCYVIPSHKEAMGLTELEAQAMNIPVIAADTDGLNEVVEHDRNCLLVRKNDPADIAEKILILFNNPSIAKRLTQEGLKNVENYSLNNYLRNLDHIYQNLHREKIE